MWYQTELTRRLRLKYPIIQAGRAGSTTPELVAEVSRNGGLGTIGAGYFSPEDLAASIKQVKARTSKPFAVNLFVPETFSYTEEAVERMNTFLKPYQQSLNLSPAIVGEHSEAQFEAMIDIIVNLQVPVCSFTFGIPSKAMIQRLKKANIFLIGNATTVEEAIAVEEAGLDFVVAQGSEAGGHRGTFKKEAIQSMIGTMALVPQVVDHVSIPVIAAGGIMDGRGWIASLALGANAVQLGTAFLTTKESQAKSIQKRMIFESDETDTIVTKVLSGKAARGIKNKIIENLEQSEVDVLPYPIQNDLTKQIRATAAKSGQSEWIHVWSGQGVRLAKDDDVNTLFKQLLNQAQQQIDKFNL